MLTVISRVALIFVIAALIVLAATGNLLSAAPLVIGLQLLAVALAIWARRSFPAAAFRVSSGPAADAVIRRGPYRLIRHPMYSAALLVVWAGVLAHIAVWPVALGLVLTVVVAIRIAVEERGLRARYADYASYMRNTKALVPYLL
jgi:protein-S-isoprenylcysteine O-methyltransferase Ste14